MKTQAAAARETDPRKQRIRLPRLRPAAGPKNRGTHAAGSRTQNQKYETDNMNTLKETQAGRPAAAPTAGDGRQQYVIPEVNIFETRDGYVLQAEMPGVNKDGLEIMLEGNELTIHGRRADAAPAGELVWRESTPADYRRVFELDPAIDTAKIDAKVDQGLLTLHLPKSERVKPRKVTVSD